jgi:drug/metabolite transporter (DMT)-like permease
VDILLALGAAVSYGASDFTGGVLSKTTAVFLVLLISQIVSLAVLLAVLPFWEADYSTQAIAWGATAGAAGVAGASALYRGLSVGRMSVVAPISGVLAAGIPVLVGLWLGERPTPLALMGVGAGLVAVVAVSRTPDPGAPAGSTSSVRQQVTAAKGPGRGVLEGLGGGIGFGLFFVLLERSPADSGLWPLVGMRTSMIAVAAVVAIGRLSRSLPTGLVLRLGALGVINVLADLLYLLATRHGLLSLVAVITSLYPAVTVILSRSILREPMDMPQVVGLLLAAASVVLIALG